MTAAPTKNWYIGIVANNTEAVSAERLGRDYEVFLPAQKVTSIWKDGRRKQRLAILIPGKIFIHCTEQERMQSMSGGIVKRYMVDIASRANQFGRRPVAIVPDDQMERLMFILGQQDVEVTIDNHDLKAGEKVRVIKGCLMGLDGFVDDWTGNTAKVRIRIEHLGCACVEVEISDVERIKE